MTGISHHSPTPLPFFPAAYAAPALSVYVCKEWILGPVRRSIRSRKLRTQLREQATAIEAATKQAAAAAELLGPVATRRTRQEAARVRPGDGWTNGGSFLVGV